MTSFMSAAKLFIKFMMIVVKVLSAFLTIHAVVCSNCSLSPALLSEICSYETVVKQIARFVLDEDGPFKNLVWTKVANFVDDFGSRMVGSQNLENAIDFLQSEFRSFGLDNVHTENATVRHWVR